MRGSVAKKLRRHVEDRFKFLSSERLYLRLPTGTIRIAQQSKRAVYQALKRNYKRRKKNAL